MPAYVDKEVRNAMASFWDSHSKEASVEEMMLDSEAEFLGREEIPEVMSLLPELKGKDVLELGAGIGRFTGKLAEKAKSVIAVDFVQKFIKKNEAENGNYKNVSFRCEDATKMEIPVGSLDVIFSNWLFMYLSDEEVRTLLANMLSWLRPGGMLFFRESCFHPSGNKKNSDSNPTYYRVPAAYMTLLESSHEDENGRWYGYEVILSRSIFTYIKYKGNPNQVCWLVEKVEHPEWTSHGFKTFQQFLDTQQYSRNGILRYEKIFGRHFVSTGGKETTEEFVDMLDLKSGQIVLDVGSGIGGSAFYMAEKFDVRVLGMDLSSNMISIGMERLDEIKDHRVLFEVGDATKRKFPPGSFDVVYSRDTILHIPDKKALFQSFYDWLKPGGKVLISDYCCSEGEHSEAFKKYVAQRGYVLLSPPAYGKVLESVGFENVRAEDRSQQFIDVLNSEVKRAEGMKEEFIKEFSAEDYDYIVDGWKSKLQRVGKGDQRWGLFYAEKPLN